MKELRFIQLITILLASFKMQESTLMKAMILSDQEGRSFPG